MSISPLSATQFGRVQRSPQLPNQPHQAASVKFSGLPASPVTPRKLLEHLDFIGVGASPVKQIAVIFSSLITWRLLAADQRRRTSVSKRWNELRENLLRDLLGFAFWFLGVPVLQRVYLAQVSKNNPHLKDILIRYEAVKPEDSKGLMGWIKAHNPLSNRYIPSSQQVKDQMHQALSSLEKAGMGATHSAHAETKAAYLNLIKHRNLGTALGLGSTILLLGVGINLLNFRLTKNNVSRNAATPNPAPPPAQPLAPGLNPQPQSTNLSSVAQPVGIANPGVPFAPPIPVSNLLPLNAAPSHFQPNVLPGMAHPNPFILPVELTR